MKKVIFIIALVAIIVIGLGVYNYMGKSDKDVVGNDTNKVVSKDKVEFDATKMKSAAMAVYEKDDRDRGTAGLKVKIKSGKAYLTTDVEDEQYKFLFSEVTEAVKDKEITGFSSNIKETYFAFMGNGDMTPIILFLMDDGTVEYTDSSKMLKEGKYESFGKIEELSKIVKFVDIIATDVSETGELLGGYVTVAAIDEDGYSFDLSLSKTLQANME